MLRGRLRPALRGRVDAGGPLGWGQWAGVSGGSRTVVGGGGGATCVESALAGAQLTVGQRPCRRW